MNIFITNLDEDGARISEQIARDGEAVAKVSEVAVNAVPPGIPEGLNLLGLPSDMPGIAVPHVTAGR